MSQLVLIDFSSIAHPLWHTTASESEQNPNAMSQAVVAKIRALASGQPHVALCLDSRKSFRKSLDASYKAARETKPAAFFHQCQLALETLRADGFLTWEAEGFEADDIIASAIKRLPEHGPLDPDVSGALIVSADKDLLQLIRDNVKAKNPASGNVLDTEGVVEKFGVQPHQILDWLTLVGDASDGVTGVRGIGAKGAAAILNTFGNLDDCYAAMDKGEAKLKPAAFAALNEFRPRLALTRQLLTLRTDAPIAFDDIFKERVPTDVAVFGTEDEIMNDIQEAMPTREMSGDEATAALGAFTQQKMKEISSPARAVSQAEGLVSPLPEPSSPAGVAPSRSGNSGLLSHAPAPATGNPAGESARSAVSRGVETTAALVPVEFERQLEPRNIMEAKQVAEWMFQSRLFSQYGVPQAVLSTIIAGREIGMPAMASLRAFMIVEGQPTYSADLIRALVIRSPHCEYFRCVERTPLKATWVTKRKGDDKPTSLTFTIEEGRAAWQKDQKAWDNSAWGKRPINMVTKTASSQLARLVYADVVMNMYCPEEME